MGKTTKTLFFVLFLILIATAVNAQSTVIKETSIGQVVIDYSFSPLGRITAQDFQQLFALTLQPQKVQVGETVKATLNTDISCDAKPVRAELKITRPFKLPVIIDIPVPPPCATSHIEVQFNAPPTTGEYTVKVFVYDNDGLIINDPVTSSNTLIVGEIDPLCPTKTVICGEYKKLFDIDNGELLRRQCKITEAKTCAVTFNVQTKTVCDSGFTESNQKCISKETASALEKITTNLRLGDGTKLFGKERIIVSGKGVPVKIEIENPTKEEKEIFFEVGIYLKSSSYAQELIQKTLLGRTLSIIPQNTGATNVQTCTESKDFIQSYKILKGTVPPGDKKSFVAYPTAPTLTSTFTINPEKQLLLLPERNFKADDKDYIVFVGLYEKCGLGHIDAKAFSVTMFNQQEVQPVNIAEAGICLQTFTQGATTSTCDKPFGLDPPIVLCTQPGQAGCEGTPTKLSIPRTMKQFKDATETEVLNSLCSDDAQCDTSQLKIGETTNCIDNKDTESIIKEKTTNAVNLRQILTTLGTTCGLGVLTGAAFGAPGSIPGLIGGGLIGCSVGVAGLSLKDLIDSTIQGNVGLCILKEPATIGGTLTGLIEDIGRTFGQTDDPFNAGILIIIGGTILIIMLGAFLK